MKSKYLVLVTLLAGLFLFLTLNLFTFNNAHAEPTAVEFPVIADFEGGVPSGWFVYSENGTGIDTAVAPIADTDPEALPGQVGSNDVLSVTANASSFGGYGGFGAPLNPVQDWSDYDAVSFWFYGSSSDDVHEFEIQTAPGDDRRATFVDNFTGWRQIVLPFTTFGSGGAYDLSQVDNWVFILDGTDGSFLMNDVQLVNIQPFADFEGGVPDGWFAYDGGGIVISTAVTTTTDTDPLALPGQIGTNDILSVTTTVTGNDANWWGGFGAALNPVQDWSDMQGVSFWFYGENSGQTYNFEIQTIPGDDRRAAFVDNFTGWQLITLPFTTFGATPYDVSQVDNWVLVLDGLNVSFKIDHIGVYGDAGNVTLRTAFTTDSYTVTEGDSVTLTVTLNMTATDPVTVSYETVDDTAVAGVHYTAASGSLVFPPGTDAQTFTVDTIDNSASDGNKALSVILTDTVNAALGAFSEATVTIDDDESICASRINAVDDFESGIPSGVDGDGNEIGYVVWGDFWNGTSVTITTNLVSDADPLALPGQSGDNTLYQLDLNVAGWGGTTHAFENAAVDTWTPQDWSSYEGISFWLYGQNTGNTIFFEIQDNRNPGSTGTDTEIWNYTFTDDFSGWQRFELQFDEFTRKEIGNGAPNDGFTLTEVHGWAYGSLGTDGADVTYYMDNVSVCGLDTSDPVTVQFDQAKVSANEGDTAVLTATLNRPYTETLTVDYAAAEATARVDRQYTPVSGTLTFPISVTEQTIEIPTFADGKHTGDERVAVNLYEGSAPLGFQRRAVLTIVDTDPVDPQLLDDFEGFHPFINSTGNVTLSVTTIMDNDAMAVPGQPPYEDALTAVYDGAVAFDRIYAQGQDWSSYDGLSFWYYGGDSGETVAVELKDNMTAATGMVDPGEWELVWSDEFNDPAGAPPNPNIWQHELGDGALNEIVGWGNSESQYYTNDLENAFTDGDGNLVIRMNEVNTDTTDLVCWYGPCEYTSARLITQDRLDFEYGRIEARVKVPGGPDGLWPAFWMLGDDIDEVGWPQSGEIDIMEYVSRLPNEIFGTIHGPGYSGGASFGDTYTFTEPVADDYHTFAIEWRPDQINWYVDGVHYHEAIPDDVTPNEWVYNHPFFILLNTAIGGNFGGAIADDMTMPQDTLIDYVRVYQAADTAERFEATFVDDFTGWRKIVLPFSDFGRSADQPADAPDDGLTLTSVWGYGFQLEGSGPVHMDQVRLATIQTLYMPLVFSQP